MPTGKVRKTHYTEGKEFGLIEHEKGAKLVCYILDLTENRLKYFSEGDRVRFDPVESVVGYEARDITKLNSHFLNSF